MMDMHHLPGNPLLVLAASLKPLKTKRVSIDSYHIKSDKKVVAKYIHMHM